MVKKDVKLNKTTALDLPKLIDSRLLVQANSGGGKSWALRRLLEQSHGKVQQIVIDLEGEFSTLREKHDYILAGKGGDTPAEPKSAALLARKILELNVSAIIDLYELYHYDRKRFVKLFLDALVNAPKKLWHPALVIVDEAHVFCPEKGQAESSEAVIDLMTRGRKRGYCGVLATQRISKLHKDAAAECNNKLIGRTGLDIDMKRASEELGFNSKDQTLSLRNLEAGEFYSFGPALSNEVTKIKIGDVKTSHPKAGYRILTKVIPPTAKIKNILGKLADLPEEAKKEATTIKELKTEITTLRRHRCPKVTSQEDIDKAVQIALAGNTRIWEKYSKDLRGVIASVGITLEKTQLISLPEDMKPIKKVYIVKKDVPLRSLDIKSGKVMPVEEPSYDPDEKSLTGGALRMVKVLASRYPMQMTKTQLATFSKLSPRSGTYGTYMSILRSRGYITEDGNLLYASGKALEEFDGESLSPQTSEEIIAMWQGILKGGTRRMFDVLIDNYPDALSKEELGLATDLSHGSGTFGTYLSMLRSNSLIETNGNEVKISENLFI